MANNPTGPQPQTATVSPGRMSHISAPMWPVGRMSERNNTWSSLRSLSIFRGPMSANGTRSGPRPGRVGIACDPLDDLGLSGTLSRFVSDWSRAFAVPAECHTTGLASIQVPAEVATNLYRIAQER